MNFVSKRQSRLIVNVPEGQASKLPQNSGALFVQNTGLLDLQQILLYSKGTLRHVFKKQNAVLTSP
jgi:hypothetical protein